MKISTVLVMVLAAGLIHSATCCSFWDWAECGGVVVACAAVCIDPLDGICEACMGSMWPVCKDCIGLEAQFSSLVSFTGNSNQMCSSSDWLECTVATTRCEAVCDMGITTHQCGTCLGDSYDNCVYCIPEIGASSTELAAVTLKSCSAWDWAKCAAKVTECAVTCKDNGITSSQCISCFGSSYSTCKKCIGLGDALAAQATLRLGCGIGSWVKCAAVVAQCSVECIDNGITSPQCFNCLGSSYSECIGCISNEEMSKNRAVTKGVRAEHRMWQRADKDCSGSCRV